MLTPNFKVDQDDRFVLVEIDAPNSRVEKTQFELLDNLIIFSSPPYYLRINLPAEIESTEDESCEWDCQKSCYNLRVPKRVVGEHFEGLDMITRLLAAPKTANKKQNRPKIEVIGSETSTNMEENEDEEDKEEEEEEEEMFNLKEEDFYFEQTMPEVVISSHNYGFNRSYSNVLEKFQDEIWQLIDLKHPGKTSLQQRRELRWKSEESDFEEEHYLCDLYDDPVSIDRLIQFQASWEQKGDQDNDKNEKFSKFTVDEIFVLKNLPKKEFFLDSNEKRTLLYGLVDILFAYAYDQRINEEDSCSESAWTIGKLSSTLCWLDDFTSIQDVVVSCCRRSLCYPLYRHFGLARKVLQDVVCILKLGPVFVIKCALQIRRMFNEYGDFKYLLNDLYLTDYCVWLQTVQSKYFDQLAHLLERRLDELKKEMIGLDIPLVEKAAQLAIEEEESLQKGLEGISLQ